MYVTGHFNSRVISFDSVTDLTNIDTTGGTAEVYLVKYNNNRFVLWALKGNSGGINNNVYSSGITSDGSGNVYITGHI